MIGSALAGSWGPTLAALAATALDGGRASIRDLLRRCLHRRSRPVWYLVACLLPPALMALGLLLFAAFGNETGDFAPGRWTAAIFALAISLPAGPLGEELGWRGYLLPRLSARLGTLRSSLMIGLIWWSWHIPLFWAPMGTTVSGTAVTVWAALKYLAYVVGLSVIFTWLFNCTGGSLLLVIVLHLTINADLVTVFFPQLSADDIRTVREFSTIPLWGVAIALIGLRWPGTPARARGQENPGPE